MTPLDAHSSISCPALSGFYQVSLSARLKSLSLSVRADAAPIPAVKRCTSLPFLDRFDSSSSVHVVVLLRRCNPPPGPVCYDSRATYLLFHQKKTTKKNNFSPFTSSTPSIYSATNTYVPLLQKPSKNQNSKPVRRSDEISQELSESRQSSSDSVAVLFQSFPARVRVGDASKAEGGLTYPAFTVFISRLYPVCSKESRP